MRPSVGPGEIGMKKLLTGLGLLAAAAVWLSSRSQGRRRPYAQAAPQPEK